MQDWKSKLCCRAGALPYHMGNAGDLLKHGMLAEFVRWRWGAPAMANKLLSFYDFFGGKPWDDNAHPEVARRVQALTNTALLEAQPEIAQGRYYGSAHLVWQAAENAGAQNIQICASDSNPDRGRKLRDSGLIPVTEKISLTLLPHEKTPPYDGYEYFVEAADSRYAPGDLALIDPFADFLPRKSEMVVPEMAKMSEHAAVVLFALNLNPDNKVGRRFDALLKKHLPGALKMTCPPIPKSQVEGEGKYCADVILAGPNVAKADELQKRLSTFAEKLATVLGLSGDNAKMLKPKTIRGI